MDGARPVRAPRGTELTARSWQTEGARIGPRVEILSPAPMPTAKPEAAKTSP